tara:strand:- start:925 stop:1329 length:405 start_codon:yes stop_codon:yes gene_type:complete
MNTLSLQLVSPDKSYFVGTVEMVVIPGEEGDFSVLPDHAPLITYLRPGKLTIMIGKESKDNYFVGSGFVKVDNNNCKILVDYIKAEVELNIVETKKQLELVMQNIENEKDETAISRLLNKKQLLQEQEIFIEST